MKRGQSRINSSHRLGPFQSRSLTLIILLRWPHVHLNDTFVRMASSSPTINHETALLAFARLRGTPFEKFVNAFLPDVLGAEFVPLGGGADGGADAFQGVSEGRTGVFYQATVEKNFRDKIRRTVNRLREV
jgi:hypothetical protein